MSIRGRRPFTYHKPLLLLLKVRVLIRDRLLSVIKLLPLPVAGIDRCVKVRLLQEEEDKEEEERRSECILLICFDSFVPSLPHSTNWAILCRQDWLLCLILQRCIYSPEGQNKLKAIFFFSPSLFYTDIIHIKLFPPPLHPCSATLINSEKKSLFSHKPDDTALIGVSPDVRALYGMSYLSLLSHDSRFTLRLATRASLLILLL